MLIPIPVSFFSRLWQHCRCICVLNCCTAGLAIYDDDGNLFCTHRIIH